MGSHQFRCGLGTALQLLDSVELFTHGWEFRVIRLGLHKEILEFIYFSSHCMYYGGYATGTPYRVWEGIVNLWNVYIWAFAKLTSMGFLTVPLECMQSSIEYVSLMETLYALCGGIWRRYKHCVGVYGLPIHQYMEAGQCNCKPCRQSPRVRTIV
jgi:hypothetical protein